jgi:hypothetical protein
MKNAEDLEHGLTQVKLVHGIREITWTTFQADAAFI